MSNIIKLSPETREILKNFASINQGIIIYPGNKLVTMSQLKQTFSVAEVPDTFPVKCAIYDMNRLLAVISIFDEPEIEFNDSDLVVREGRRSMTYQYAAAGIIVAPPEGKEVYVKDPDVMYSFWMSKDQMQSMFKAAGIMKHPEIIITREEIATINTKIGPDSYKIELIDVEGEKDFTARLRIENMKFIPGDYEVRVTNKNVEFVSTDEKRVQRYVVMLEAKKNG